MTHPPEQGQTLDEQIIDAVGELSQNEAWLAIGPSNPEAQEAVAMSRAKLASLRRLKAIDEAVVPEEPERVKQAGLEMLRSGAKGISHPDSEYLLYILKLRMFAQQSAEAARVARENIGEIVDEAERVSGLSVSQLSAKDSVIEIISSLKQRAETAESRLREVEARTVDRCAEGLERLIAVFKEASEKRYAIVDESYAEAAKWKAEGDGYGYNFYQGRASGCNQSDIFYFAVHRQIEKELAAIRALPSSTDTEEK